MKWEKGGEGGGERFIVNYCTLQLTGKKLLLTKPAQFPPSFCKTLSKRKMKYRLAL